MHPVQKTYLPRQIEASCLQTEQVQLILELGEMFLSTSSIASSRSNFMLVESHHNGLFFIRDKKGKCVSIAHQINLRES